MIRAAIEQGGVREVSQRGSSSLYIRITLYDEAIKGNELLINTTACVNESQRYYVT